MTEELQDRSNESGTLAAFKPQTTPAPTSAERPASQERPASEKPRRLKVDVEALLKRLNAILVDADDEQTHVIRSFNELVNSHCPIVIIQDALDVYFTSVVGFRRERNNWSGILYWFAYKGALSCLDYHFRDFSHRLDERELRFFDTLLLSQAEAVKEEQIEQDAT